MKIYFIGQKGIPATGGGVERHVEELAVRLARLGQEVFVFARKKYTQAQVLQKEGVNIIYTPAIYTKHLEAISHTLFSALSLINKKVDIIHIHSIGPSLMIPLLRLIKPHSRIVATVHSPDYFHQKWNRFARFMLRAGEKIAATWSDEVITVSKNLQQYLWHAYHCQAKYIPNGVNIPAKSISFQPLKAWGLRPDGYIVAISRLVRHKGLHLLIEAYKQLKTEKKLVIVGDGHYTDDYVAQLRQLAEGNDQIIFTGNQKGQALQALFAYASVFVQPSESEGLSIALLEALSHNLAVVASDIPENREVIDGLGLTFKNGDSKDLANQLALLLNKPAVRKMYEGQGREFVKKYFDWDKIAQETLCVYERGLKNESPLYVPKKFLLTK